MMRIIGEGGGKGGGSGGNESDDTLFSSAYVEIVEAYSEGPIQGLVDGERTIYLDSTPIVASSGYRNHQAITEFREGYQNQDPFAVVQNASSESSVNLKIEKAVPIVQTITNDQADRAVVTIGFPRMTSIDGSGNINGTSVDFLIEMQPYGESYRTVSRQSSISNGPYNNANNYYQSPDNTYLAVVFLWSSIPATVTVQHSTDGITFTDLQTVTLYYNNNAYSFSLGFTLSEGVHYLRWGGGGTVNNGIHWYSYGATGNIRISGKSGSRYQKQFAFDLAGSAPWQIRVTRITNDSNSAKLSNEIYWDSLRTEVTAKLAYPLTALIYYRINSKEFSAIPRRQVRLLGKLISVPTNYDPVTRTYSGIWDGSFKTLWSNNPAWIFYDLATAKRYGSGKYVKTDGINKWALYQIAQYCDELVDSGRRDDAGGVILEPRFTCNIQIATAREAFQWLNDIASIFRGMLYVMDGLLTSVADQPSDPVMLFNKANVINGSFKFQGSAALARKTVALVKWRDPNDLFNEKTEYVPYRSGIKRYGINQAEITAVGCTSRGQAKRLGRWVLIDSELVEFSTGHDAAFIAPGDIVQCAIPLRSNNKRLGGRLINIEGTAVVLDSAVDLTAGHSYQLSVMMPDGSIESRDVLESGDAITHLTLASAFSQIPVENAIWVLVDWDGVQPTQWRVLSIGNGEGITKKITALSHDPDKFYAIDNFDAAIDSSGLPFKNPLSIDSPKNITVEIQPFVDKNGLMQNVLQIHWEQVTDADRYQLRWRLNDGQWIDEPTQVGTLYERIVKSDGIYDVQVIAVNLLGKKSPPSSLTATVTGESGGYSIDSQWTEF